MRKRLTAIAIPVLCVAGAVSVMKIFEKKTGLIMGFREVK